MWCIHRSKVGGHPTGDVRLEFGCLWFVWCASDRLSGHPNRWMIVWRRGIPEFNPTTKWKTRPPKFVGVDHLDFPTRADADEPYRVDLIKRLAPIACFRCDHPDAPKARKEAVAIVKAIRDRKPLSDAEGDLPVNCCRRQRLRELYDRAR
jgi:hypothetical protein